MTAAAVPIVAELLATWAPASSTTGVAGTLGSTVTVTRWVVPVPDVDAAVTVTVFNPGPDPVTAEVLAAGDVDRAGRPDERARAGDRARQGEDGSPRGPGVARSRPSSPRTHAVVVGYTVLGNVGVATRAPRFPISNHADLTRPDSSAGG